MPIITLTTDFGTRDGYVGAVKGVIARIAPKVRILDIAHDIPRGDIAHAAWVVATSTLEFPAGTIHLVVVDPGVGGARDGIVAVADTRSPRGEQLFVGPDNGVFGYLPITRAFVIENKDMLAPTISSTFHGRDVFAHVAAHLAEGYDPLQIGPVRLQPAAQLPWGKRERGKGRVVHIDHYGNLITDLPRDEAAAGVVLGSRRLPLLRTYEDVPSGELLAYVGSAGTVEIAVRDGSAARMIGLERGAIVEAVADDSTSWPPQSGPYR